MCSYVCYSVTLFRMTSGCGLCYSIYLVLRVDMPDALAMIIVERTYIRCSNTKQHHTYTPYILRTWKRTYIQTTHMRVRRTLHSGYWWIWGNNGLGGKISSGPSGERGRARRADIGMK